MVGRETEDGGYRQRERERKEEVYLSSYFSLVALQTPEIEVLLFLFVPLPVLPDRVLSSGVADVLLHAELLQTTRPVGRAYHLSIYLSTSRRDEEGRSLFPSRTRRVNS